MTHPYDGAPDYRRWRKAVADLPLRQVDPVICLPFKITRRDKVMTAGSCFAQHIARHLRQHGFHYLETETAHPLLPLPVASAFNYGIYTARYGNIYTARQLLQLLRRAYGRFTPDEDVWVNSGHYFDPYRPAIQPDGFASLEEYAADRRQHFAAVRLAFETMDYFIFTLGLTEGWLSRSDGAAFPVCPGTIAGSFDARLHAFTNDGVDATTSLLTTFVDELREINPNVKIVLTVSPVPLAATAEDRHVLVANSYSKSVLRIACEELTKLPDVFYFPAYEIITGAFSRGAYFDHDLRSVREEGVQHVMDVFFRHAAVIEESIPADFALESSELDFSPRMRKVMDTLCEEAYLDPPDQT